MHTCCGTALSDAEISSLLYMSEGWFSAIYLHLRTLAERGTLPNRKSDIYTMFTAAMIAPLPADAREFLAVMGLADEFTLEMAHFITETPHTEKLLTTLTEQNAFVKRLPDGKVYRFHHMMKECAKRTFHTLPPEKQAAYRAVLVSGMRSTANICMPWRRIGKAEIMMLCFALWSRMQASCFPLCRPKQC